jgi:hypothetical protein
LYEYVCYCNRKALFTHQEREDDILKLLEFFQKCKRANEYFYWDAQTDKETCRIKKNSGAMLVREWNVGILETITFDTTHKTNANRMPLAMFVGSNNRLQNVVFGQALLRDESSTSFVWLFETRSRLVCGDMNHMFY